MNTQAGRIRNEHLEAAAFDRLADQRSKVDLRTSDAVFSRYRSAVLGHPLHESHPDRVFLHIGSQVRRSNDPRRPLEGVRVLDLGAGDGLWSVIFAEQGAEVTSVEISPRQVELARMRMRFHNLEWNASVGSAFTLGEQFPAGSFDLVYAHAILHHLTLDLASVFKGMHHLLRDGGHATINEPYCSSPRLRRLRGRLAWLIPFDQETPDERTCDDDDFRSLSTLFSDVVVERYDLSARFARRVFGSTRMERAMFRLDRFLLRRRMFKALAGGIFIAVRK